MARFTSEFSNSIFSVNHLVAPYDVYMVEVDYDIDMGTLQLPVSPPATLLGSSQAAFLAAAEIVQARLPYGVKTVSWLAQRLGAHPNIPDPNVSDTNLVLAAVSVKPLSPSITGDGDSRIYRVVGQYVYHEYFPNGPVGVGLINNMAYPSTDADAIGTEQLPQGDFTQGLVN